MKEVFIVRHSYWNKQDDQLTTEGIGVAKKRATELPEFKLVVSSPANRTQQTAKILGQKEVVTDERAGIPKDLRSIGPKLDDLINNHPYGVVGALFEVAEARPIMQLTAKSMGDLIKETLEKLYDNENALIVTHDGVLAATEKFLKSESFDTVPDHSYEETRGFAINQDLELRTV